MGWALSHLALSQNWGRDLAVPPDGVGSLRHGAGVEGGGTNPCDVGLDLSGSWQQGHSATYNAPSRI